VLNNVAWFLATSPDPEIRNAFEATRLAQRACELSNQTNLWFLHTLAAAYAEAGDFTNATTTAEIALKQADATHSETLIQNARQRVNLFRAGRTLRSASAQ